MNKAQKIIWTVFLVGFPFTIILAKFARLLRPSKEAIAIVYLIYGGIVAIILHFIWKDKKKSSKIRKT